MKPQCNACLKFIDISEYLENGGYCKECSKEVDRIYKEEGSNGVRRYIIRKRKEAMQEQL